MQDVAQKTQQPLRQSRQSLKVLDAPPARGGGKEDAPRASTAFPPKAALSKCGLGNIRSRLNLDAHPGLKPTSSLDRARESQAKEFPTKGIPCRTLHPEGRGRQGEMPPGITLIRSSKGCLHCWSCLHCSPFYNLLLPLQPAVIGVHFLPCM